MLSLPLLAPQNEYSFFLSPHLRPPPTSNDPSSHTTDNNAAQQSRRQNNLQSSAPTRQSLAQLLADEHAISSRKHNIRRFGAGWIKPPGVAKTLQAETEEKIEREEQEAQQRREQMMMDMQAQQEVEEARNRANAAAEEENPGGEEEQEERDLDEEIPDADVEDEESEGDDISDSDEDDDEEEEEMQSEMQSEMLSQIHSEIPIAEDITFNEESMFADTSMAALDQESREQERYRHLQEAELTGVAQDELDLGIERDLDDSVPEAGSYQHTDSELDDSDDDDEDDESEEEEEQSQLQQHEDEQSEMVGAAVMQRSRSSLLSRDVSSLLDSSFVTSSPAPIGRLRSTGHMLNLNQNQNPR
ncbi:hypothetical protein E4T39_08318 [Aureobasidium subglaciale]|nr:hypothetical protein E4T39_08318 [Aureobasidium subglaciale]